MDNRTYLMGASSSCRDLSMWIYLQAHKLQHCLVPNSHFGPSYSHTGTHYSALQQACGGQRCADPQIILPPV